MIRSYTNKIIAVDFDGTLCENKYPRIGKPRKRVIKRLLKEQTKGAKIILWTCRTGQPLQDAFYWCMNHGIVFDAVNDSLEESKLMWGTDPRKICADEYWDDKARRIR